MFGSRRALYSSRRSDVVRLFHSGRRSPMLPHSRDSAIDPPTLWAGLAKIRTSTQASTDLRSGYAACSTSWAGLERPLPRDARSDQHDSGSCRQAQVGRADPALFPTHQCTRLLCGALNVNRYSDDPWTCILVDFMYYNLMFCEEHGFLPEQTSAFFSIMKAVFEHTFQRCDTGNKVLSMQESYGHFKRLVRRYRHARFKVDAQMTEHAVDSADDGCVGLFSVHDVKHVASFISGTFYRHFKMYEYCFVHPQNVDLYEREIVAETPLEPLPLAEGVLLEVPLPLADGTLPDDVHAN